MLTNIHLRKVDSELLRLLKQKALENKISLNSLIINLLKQSLGLSTSYAAPVYHDLDMLAGTWDKQDGLKFNKEISAFEKIDRDLW